LNHCRPTTHCTKARDSVLLRLVCEIVNWILIADELWGSLKVKTEVMLPPQDIAYQMREFGTETVTR